MTGSDRPNDVAAGSVIRPGETCWRLRRAARMAVLIDNDAFFAAALQALRHARRSIFLLGWTFDPRTRLGPQNSGEPTIGEVLNAIARDRPKVEIRLLVWDAALVIAGAQDHYPQRAREHLHPRIRLHLDDRHPTGACHHAKLLVIDDALAFCSGEDFSMERWDSPDHHEEDERRRLPSGEFCGPRHGATALVQGATARALAAFGRMRWREATGEELPEAPDGLEAPWPDRVDADFRDVDVAVARTMPADARRREIPEGEALFLAAIAAARRSIYLENQYFAAPALADALAQRLSEPDGPEVVVICSPRSPNIFDRLTMDPARDILLGRLRDADLHARLSVLAPHTPAGKGIVVHSKLMIVDDRFLRIGSSNLNDRSMWLDTECDIAVEIDPESAGAGAIAKVRNRLLAHFLGCSEPAFVSACREHGGLVAAIDRFGFTGRLREVTPADDTQILGQALDLETADPAVLAHRAGRPSPGHGVLLALLTATGLACLILAARRRRQRVVDVPPRR